MLIYRRTGIFESTAQTLVNTVNCVGVMGKGIAKEFKKRDPAMFKAYRELCARKLITPGTLWLWQGSDRWILNFPTKMHWRDPSRLEWIEAGLKKFVAEYAVRGVKTVSFPRLGCGNGGLDWDDVKPMMAAYLRDIPIPVFIHDYEVDIGLPEHLEAISRRLKSEEVLTTNFDSFVSTMRRVVELCGNDMVDLSSKSTFTARMDGEDNLAIETESSKFYLERDDLRGVWVSLLAGLVTREKAGWSSNEIGGAVLSMLSILPQVRPVEIQRSERPSEIAVELKPVAARTSPVPVSEPQSELAWA